jgi:hypothetical protein
MSLKIQQISDQIYYPYAQLTEQDIESLAKKYANLSQDDLLDLQSEIPLCDL